MMPKSLSEIYRDAAASVRLGSWDRLDKYACALFHLAVAADVNLNYMYTDSRMQSLCVGLVKALDLPRHAMTRIGDDVISRVYGWNDFTCRHAEDCAAGFERAADYWDLHTRIHEPFRVPAPKQELVTC